MMVLDRAEIARRQAFKDFVSHLATAIDEVGKTHIDLYQIEAILRKRGVRENPRRMAWALMFLEDAGMIERTVYRSPSGHIKARRSFQLTESFNSDAISMGAEA